MEGFEDQLNSIRTEWQVWKEKWFHGETIDPVFEGTVRDFWVFDETMRNVYNRVGIFMKGVDQLAHGMTELSDGVTSGLTRSNDDQIASDSCKMKEATNQIARADAPHSAIAKLKRDMNFNILNPVQQHIANNRNLKVSLDIRRRRLVELNSAKKLYDECVKRKLTEADRRYVTAKSNFEAARTVFSDVDRHVFEWLYILEEYRGDILDSTLQTLKYLEYEFFATSAHAISSSLPTQMEFRPMVEMTPEHLEAQVEMELKESEEDGAVASTGAEVIADFSTRLIDKKVKEEPSEADTGPALPVDPLSLSSLLSQGFEEGPARRALRLHQNDTQAALDWLIDGQHDDTQKQKQVSDGVRMPTTVKRVQKLKAMRRAQQEKLREKQRREEEQEREAEDQKEQRRKGYKNKGEALGEGSAINDERSPKDRKDGEDLKGWPSTGSRQEEDNDGDPDLIEEHKERTPDLMEDMMDMNEPMTQQVARSSGDVDLLSLDDETPALPTDFSQPIERTELPAQLSFDTRFCEKQPLPAAVAAGIVQPRGSAQVVQQLSAEEGSGLLSLDMGAVPSLANVLSSATGGLPANLMPVAQVPDPVQAWPGSLADMVDVTTTHATAPHKAASSLDALDPLGFA